MNNKFLLLLGANQFQRERSLIGAERAFQGTVLTTSPIAPFHANKYPSTTIHSHETCPDELLKDVLEFVAKTKLTPAAVIPLNDFVLNAGSAIAQHFGLVYNIKETLENCRTKDLMKKVLNEAGIPVVQSHRFKTYAEAKQLAMSLGFPLVIKPLNFGGSGGVVKVLDLAELETAIIHTQDHLQKYAGHYDSDTSTMLIESYIEIKREVSVEVINTPDFRTVIGITDKYLSEEPYFSEIAHTVPSSIMMNSEISEKIKAVAITACAALKIQYGMAHVEMKVADDGSCMVIEVGVRTAGDGIMDLYEKATGTNIYELHCKAFLGTLKEHETKLEFRHGAAIGYLHPELGFIEKIDTTVLESRGNDNIDLISVRTHVGAEVFTAKDWSTRYGFIEYTFINNPTLTGFNLIDNTKRIADQIFTVRKVG